MKVGSMFTGYGGLDLALEDVLDVELAWVADNEPGPVTILDARFPDVPNLGDLVAVDWTHVEPVDVLTGGTPCQDLSNAGRMRGMSHGTRSNLWVVMREAIATLRPRLVVWENVRGATYALADCDLQPCPRCMGATRGRAHLGMRALGRVLGDLSELGFDAAWLDLQAAEIGAPHRRLRIFLLAWPQEYGPPERPTDLLRRRGIVPPLNGAFLGSPSAVSYKGGGQVGTDSHAHRLGKNYLDAQIVQATHDGDLLPTPAVNDMGDGKSIEWWDEWAPRQKAADGTKAAHGRSLAIEALRDLLPTPNHGDGNRGGPVSVASRKAGGHAVNLQDVVVDNHRADQGGRYGPALARWEAITGRPSPPATEPSSIGTPRLSPRFVEWMMGLPDGWVTDLDLTRAQQLRALGNGVVPQQGAAAIARLLDRIGVPT